MSDLSVSPYSAILPWFMFDIENRQIITSPTVPGDITDSKNIVLTETPIPGLNYAPVQPAGNGNRKISFTLPLIKRNNTFGNSLLLTQFENLRNQVPDPGGFFSSQFNPNPKVIYYWGLGTVPLIYFVSNITFSHRRGWVNQIGQPQISDVNIELLLDEANPINKAEQIYRRAASIVGTVTNVVSQFTKGRKF